MSWHMSHSPTNLLDRRSLVTGIIVILAVNNIVNRSPAGERLSFVVSLLTLPLFKYTYDFRMARLEIIWDDGYHMCRTMPAILYGMVDETSFSHFCDQLDMALLQLHIEQRRKRMRYSASIYGFLFCLSLHAYLSDFVFHHDPDRIPIDFILACWALYLITIVVMAICNSSDFVERQALAKLRMICEEMSNKVHFHASFHVAMVPMSIVSRGHGGCCECMTPSASVDHINASVSGMIRDSVLMTEAPCTLIAPHSMAVLRTVLNNVTPSNDHQRMEQKMV